MVIGKGPHRSVVALAPNPAREPHERDVVPAVCAAHEIEVHHKPEECVFRKRVS